MWISREEYNKLVDKNEKLKESLDGVRLLHWRLWEENQILLSQNKSMQEQVEQLKVKYADEVKKNFELASYLSGTNNT